MNTDRPDERHDARHDERSVGELLTEADRISRLLLVEVTGADARPLGRAWRPVVVAAAGVWRELPDAAQRPGSDAYAMPRLLAHRHIFPPFPQDHRWPGEGPGDARLLDLAANLNRARALIHQHGTTTNPATPRVIADAEAARMRIMHCVYLSAHAIGVSLRRHLADLEEHAAQQPAAWRGREGPMGAAATRERFGWFEVLEQAAGSYVGSRFAAVARGEHTPHPPWGGDRLAEALASWDIQAHRTLAGDYTTRDLLEVARLQADIVAAAGAFLTAEVGTRQLDPADYARLCPALQASQTAWRHVAGRWADLRTPQSRTGPLLAAAAGEVRAAVRELAYDKTTWAPAELVATRAHLPELHEPLQLALGSATHIATRLSEVANTDPNLAGHARALAARCRADIEAGNMTPQFGALVSPAAVHANRVVDLPGPIRQTLVQASQQAAEHASRTHHATACLDRTPRPDIHQALDPWHPSPKRDEPSQARPHPRPVTP